jgi:Clp protease
MERDYFLDAEQAVEMGLVDKVLTSREEQEIAMAPLKGTKDKGDKGGGGGDGGGGGASPAQNPSPS